ncbi:sugar transferase [Corynebacterium sp. USCH3]|uniref:sugar transferase n=1 Tax=Corynebacterium sp. USCH3 TaxID=3024840 RepID=UPI00309BBAA1
MILGNASTDPSPPYTGTSRPRGSTSVQRISRALDRRQDRHLQRKWYFIASDALAIFAATFLANALSLYLWKPLGWALVEEFFSLRSLGMTTLLTMCWVVAITVCRGYSHQARAFPSIGRECVLKGSLVYAATVACVDALTNYGLFRQFALMALPAGLVLMTVTRHLARRYTARFRSDLQRQFLVIGNVSDINKLLCTSWHENNTPKDTAPGCSEHAGPTGHTGHAGWIHAILVTDPHNRDKLADTGDVPINSLCIDESFSNEDFVATAAGYNCDAVWVASLAEFGHRNLRRLSWHLDRLNMRLYLDPMIEGIAGTRLNVVPFGPSHTLYVDRPRFNAANGLSKRLFDIAVSAFALVAVSPILAVTALAIKLEDGGPVFYVSDRIGYRGQSFRIFKFRSMHTDADERLQKLRDEVGADGLFKMKDDPRVTRVGKFIRKTSIDELPQFLNALIGTMSVVGPRPHLQHEVDAFGDDMRMRMEVRPGITGLWQVSGRSDLTPTQAEKLDLYYVDNWSLALDVRTILQTVRAVVLSRGAY